jgi:Glucodextranase, domain B
MTAAAVVPLRATIAPMQPRRGDRTSQVRPRPPSTGRPTPRKVRPVSPSPDRLSHHRRIERRRGLPMPVAALLAVAIVVLGGFMLWVGVGAAGPMVSSAVRDFGAFMGSVGGSTPTATPLPSGAVSQAPVIEPPDQAYTQATTVDITVQVPASVAGTTGYTCRLWVTLPNAQPAIVTEASVGGTSVLVLPGITLAKGSNKFQASIVGPGGESKLSAPVTYILDTSKPVVTIISPANGASVSKDTMTVKGKTQAGSEVRIQNAANGASATPKADKTGLFSGSIAIAVGTNAITVTVKDPAGNTNSATITVTRGSGGLKATATATTYRIKVARLPRTVVFTVTVTGADGHHLAGATALFTVGIPGLQMIVSSNITTDANGTATFSTNIPRGAMTGSAPVAVQITSGSDTTTARTALTLE